MRPVFDGSRVIEVEPFDEALPVEVSSDISPDLLEAALRFRVAGVSYEMVAAQTGETPEQVRRRVTSILEKAPPEDVGALRALESRRLDELMLAVWPRAVPSSGKPADLRAVETVRKLIETRSRIMGVYHDSVTVNNVLVEVAGARSRLADLLLARGDHSAITAFGLTESSSEG